jgi:hypothetical protein
MPHHHQKILDVRRNNIELKEILDILQEIVEKLREQRSVTINNKQITLSADVYDFKIKYEILPRGEYSLKFDIISEPGKSHAIEREIQLS